jgi:putative iron-regulated protein
VGISGALTALLVGSLGGCKQPEPPSQEDEIRPVLQNYANIVFANYEDSVEQAEGLNAAIDSFLSGPAAGNLVQTKAAYHAARAPFTLTEAYRFYGGPVDDSWAGLNAWRMDPEFVDYTELSGQSGIINDPDTFPTIDADLLTGLNATEETPKGITTGYHVIAFLLWGEDLNTTDSQQFGSRAHTDYTDALHADRRSQYLRVTGQLVVEDLQDLADAWGEDGSFREEFVSQEPYVGIAKIMVGMRTLAEVELANRLCDRGYDWDPMSGAKLYELSPFTDRTLVDLEAAVQGMKNVYTGEYEDIAGRGIDKLVFDKDPDLDDSVKAQFDKVFEKIDAVPEDFEISVKLDENTREAIDDVRDQLRKLDELLGEVALSLEIEVEHGEADVDNEDDTTEESGTDDNGTIFLPGGDAG